MDNRDRGLAASADARYYASNNVNSGSATLCMYTDRKANSSIFRTPENTGWNSPLFPITLHYSPLTECNEKFKQVLIV